MSRARYILTLEVHPDMKVSLKLKTPVGNIEQLKEEIKMIDIEKIANLLHKKHGGVEKVLEKWEAEYNKLFNGE